MECIYEVKAQNMAENGSVDIFTKDILELTDNAEVDKIIIEMSKVKAIGSFCIGTIVGTLKTMDERKGSLVLRNTDEKIKKILKTFGLLDFLTIE